MPAMDNDKNAMAEKILRDIANVFSKDDLLEEFDLLPVETNNSNKSPVLHSEHSLGLEGWCVKYIYNYCYTMLMEQYVSKVNNKPTKVNIDNCEEVNRLLMGALLINPDVSSFWNKRKEMYLKKFIKFFDEVKFTKVLLSRKPKCNEAFAYRKWLLERYWSELVGSHYLRFAATREAELSLSHSCAQKSPNNYHAWTHRIWFMNQMGKYSSTVVSKQSYIWELRFSERWITTNVSDYSGLHYRQFSLTCAFQTKQPFSYLTEDECLNYKNSVNRIMQNICEPNVDLDTFNRAETEKEIIFCILGSVVEEKEDSKKYSDFYQKICLVVYELLLNEELSKMYTNHEALWCHRRFIITTLLNTICEYFGEGNFRSNTPINLEKPLKGILLNITNHSEEILSEEHIVKEPKLLKHHHHSVYSSTLYKVLAVNERKYIDQRTKCGDVFSVKYHRWLRLVLGFAV